MVPAEELSKLVLDKYCASCVQTEGENGVAMANNEKAAQVECQGKVVYQRRVPSTIESERPHSANGSPHV